MNKNIIIFSIALIMMLSFIAITLKGYGNVKPVPANSIKAYGVYIIANKEQQAAGVAGEVKSGDKLKNGESLITSKYSVHKPGLVDKWNKWLIARQMNGYYTIMNLYSGKYIGLAKNEDKESIKLCQYSKANTDAQFWNITNTQSKSYKIINKLNGLAITQIEDTLVVQKYTNISAQQWQITIIKPDSYRDDAVVGFFQRVKGSDAFDEGGSIPLNYSCNKGKVVWLTGDTFYDQVDNKGEFACNLIFPYHNSALIQPADHSWDPAKTVNLISNDGPQIFHDNQPKNLLWPGAGIEIRNHIYVHNIEVVTGTLNTINQYLYDITETSTNQIPHVKQLDVPNMSGQTAIIYAIGMVKPGDGYVYAYGMGGPFDIYIYVARFPIDNPTKWTFWNGKHWAEKPIQNRAAILAKCPVNNNTVGYVNGKYVLITMDFGFTCDVPGRNIYASTSLSPTGPFTEKKLVYTLPDYKQGHAPDYYNPTIHPEFDNGHNELLVNYCINFYNKNNAANETCLTPCSNPDGSEDPNDYRIKGVRIPYSMIGISK
jgi:hypothetical protein